MEVIKDTHHNTTFIRFIKHNNNMFRLTYDNRNGSPLGFDYRFQAEIKNSDNLWKVIAGTSDIGFHPISYVSDIKERQNDAKRFFNLMCEHIILIY